MKSKKAAVVACVLLLAAGLLVALSASPALAPPVPFVWEDTGGGAGFISVSNFAYDAVHDVLYAGTYGAGVWRCDDPGSPASAWSDTGIDATASVVFSLSYDSVHDILYAGTDKGLWACENPSTAPVWTEPITSIWGCRVNAVAYDSVHDALYFGWYDGGSMRYMGVWRCDNASSPSRTWANISEGVDVLDYRIDCFAYDASRDLLYAACTLHVPIMMSEDGKGVWRCSSPGSAPSWSDTGTGSIDTYIVNDLDLDPAGGLLYAATDQHGVWRCDTPGVSPSWADMGGGFGVADINDVAYDPNNNVLYVGAWDQSGVKQCHSPDTSPTWEATGGAIGTFDVLALALDPYRCILYADCYDFGTMTKQDVYRASVEPASRWYFAEGYTGPGFQEYLCLGNPTAADITARVTYLYSDGTSKSATYPVPATSRNTVDVNAKAGLDRDISMLVTSEEPDLIAERPMYFSYGPGWTGGHDAVGALEAAQRWYFAEGYTGPGFDEWICVLNPGGSPAHLSFHFQTQYAGEIVPDVQTVLPYSRASFKANTLLDGVYETSLLLVSDLPVVAERPMYFDYLGAEAPKHWTGGHCVMGATGLATEYFFAEGFTGPGFEEYLTIQNPHAADITVDAAYQLVQGVGAPVNRSYTVPARGRETVFVNSPEGLGRAADVSVHLSSSQTFLAERPMYFSYGPGWTGGHDTIGALAGAGEWFFAEGYTGPDFDEWLCIQNPGTADATVTITYYPYGGTAMVKDPFTVKGRSRYTVFVNAPENAGPGLSLSAKVSSDRPVVVERPMYFNFVGAWNGGHDVVGYAP